MVVSTHQTRRLRHGATLDSPVELLSRNGLLAPGSLDGGEAHLYALTADHCNVAGPRPLDDTDRYREGYALGEHWVETRATMHERDEIAGLRSVRWHSFPLDQHTLGKALLEAGEPADSDGRMRLARGPFAEGIIDSVIEARPVR